MRRLSFLSVIVVVLALTFATLPTFSARADTAGVVAVQLLNVRKAPSQKYPVIAQIPLGGSVTLIGRNAAGTWLEISGSFGKGWVSAPFVTIPSGQVSSLPVTDRTINPFATVIVYPSIQVRSGPSTDFPIIGVLRTGAVVDIVGQDPKTKWIEVATPFGNGWIQTQFVTLTGDIFAAPNTDQFAYPVVKNVNYRVNIRSGPATDRSVVGVLPYLQYARIIGVNANGRWWKITGDSGTGWVSASFVQAIGNLGGVPVLTE